MKRAWFALICTAGLCAPGAFAAPAAPLAAWDNGSSDCQAHPGRALQTQAYDPRTYIVRESLCKTYEGPFVYLLIGADKALLIDSGDVDDARSVPLASTVLGLLPTHDGKRLPLLVVHTHSHLDHRAGDAQFAGQDGVTVMASDLPHVIDGFGFHHWPDDIAHIDLGGRAVDVIPTPGHTDSHVSYYDSATGLLFTGDFFLPGRLVIDDVAADRASAQRLIAFARDKPVTSVLGGHVELDRKGKVEPMGSSWHPDEAPLALDRDDLMKLPGIIDSFNGFYGQNGRFVMYSQARMLQVISAVGILLLIVIALSLRWWFRRWRQARAMDHPPSH